MSDSNWLTVALFVAPFLVSGSVLWWLSNYYVSKGDWSRECARCVDDVNKLGGKMNRIREEVQSNKDRVQDALNRAEHAKSEIARQHEHIERHLITPIRELTAKMSTLEVEFGKQAERQAEGQKFVERTIAEIKDWIEADYREDRRQK